MIDIHCHMLPGIDDGARDMSAALDMAKLAVASGITHTVCTPHIYPGLYENTVDGIARATSALRLALEGADIPLTVSYGADIQIVPELVRGLQAGTLPTLHGSRYFLFEPPHHIRPPGLLELLQSALAVGFVPVITHPERLTRVESAYDQFVEAAQMGAWVQLTGGSLTGVWGPRVRAISERFLRDGITHVVASDGHNQSNRAPTLYTAWAALLPLVGEQETQRLLQARPAAVLANAAPGSVHPPAPQPPAPSRRSWRHWLGLA